MIMKNVFDDKDVAQICHRIEQLQANSQPTWGSMNVAQMLAHCNVPYQQVYEPTSPPAKGIKRFLMKLFVKSTVVGPKPYPKNSPTAPDFRVAPKQDFEAEKGRMIAYLNKTQELGRQHFEGKLSQSFGPLTADEWNVLFYKHLDHHLRQFGV